MPTDDQQQHLAELIRDSLSVVPPLVARPTKRGTNYDRLATVKLDNDVVADLGAVDSLL